MAIIIAILSIFALAGLAAFAGRVLRIRICPICAGVSGTWLWMLAAHAMDIPQDTGVILLLMGGSGVGIAYQLERRIRPSAQALFKLVFITSWMAAAWALVTTVWPVFIGAVGLDTLIFLSTRQAAQQKMSVRQKKLQERLEQCC